MESETKRIKQEIRKSSPHLSCYLFHRWRGRAITTQREDEKTRRVVSVYIVNLVVKNSSRVNPSSDDYTLTLPINDDRKNTIAANNNKLNITIYRRYVYIYMSAVVFRVYYIINRLYCFYCVYTRWQICRIFAGGTRRPCTRSLIVATPTLLFT